MFRFKDALVAVVAFCQLTIAEDWEHHEEDHEDCVFEISKKGQSDRLYGDDTPYENNFFQL